MEYPTINLIERCDDILQENLYLVNSKKIYLKILHFSLNLSCF